MANPRDNTITGFIKRAVEEICESDFNEAGYLYGEALRFSRMTHYEFETNYMKDNLDV